MVEELVDDIDYNEWIIAENLRLQGLAVYESFQNKVDVPFSQWVPVTDISLKSAFLATEEGKESPFSQARIEGKTYWGSEIIGKDFSATFPYIFSFDSFGEGDIFLADTEIFGTSGAFKITMNSGWMVKFVLFTENTNYMDHNLDDHGAYYADGEKIRFWLGQENDYISVDIDQEVTGIANFRIRKNGVQWTVTNPDNFNDEVFVRMLAAIHLQPNMGVAKYEEDANTVNLIFGEEDNIGFELTKNSGGDKLIIDDLGFEYPEASPLLVIGGLGLILLYALRGNV